jgi:hypothetical protein
MSVSKIRTTLPLLLAVIGLLTSTATASAQIQYSLQVGAWGDDASRNNSGVQAEIRTHIYQANQSDFDYFWVGDNLNNGAFIQFGYFYEPGYFCLKGLWSGETFTCLGGSDRVGSSDARWQWQYWPDGYKHEFYYEIGPAGSAGMDGTWHVYSIMPNGTDGWSFVLDGQPVGSVPFQPTLSTDPAYVVAEKVTSSQPFANLGPVEFRNLAYLKENGWNAVDSLTVLKGCAVNTDCNVDNPYGVSLKGPNHIAAGSEIQTPATSGLLWTSSYVTLDVRSHSETPFSVSWVSGSEGSDGEARIKVPKGMFADVFLLRISVPADGIFGVFGAIDEFQGWTGDESSSNATIRVLMNRDKSIQAKWSTSFGNLEYEICLFVFLVVVVVIALAYRKRKHRFASHVNQHLMYCARCGSPLAFVEQYQRWYCYNCQEYL